MSARGRPRSFDRTEALEKAMEVFWQQGFEGSSMSDLTTAMGINSPSLYAAFGSKEALYLEAVRHFSETAAAGTFRALMEAPTLREGLAAMLHASISCSTQEGRPQGCMIALGATHCAPENERVRLELKEMRRILRDTLRLKFETAVADGLLPPDLDPGSLATYFATLVHGISIQARDGATREELKAVVVHALASFDRATRVNDPAGSA
ncbi:MAG TPA: TetR/AcrR family transcriptional regulator [Microvirga sp.]|nr:TetR/AcrR family transcriptional regulator [Microvirga sp.]